MPNDINELDVNDIGLKGIFGERFKDESNEEVFTQSPEMKVNWCERKAKDIPVEAQWCPTKAEPSFTKKLMKTAKEVGLYAILSSVLFYWQQTGKIDYTTAWYALLICVGMVFFTVGKNVRGNR